MEFDEDGVSSSADGISFISGVPTSPTIQAFTSPLVFSFFRKKKVSKEQNKKSNTNHQRMASSRTQKYTRTQYNIYTK